MDIRNFLEKFRSGEIDIEEAEKILKKLPYNDLGFAKIDNHRKLRNGFGEVIYCEGKEISHLIKIFESFYHNNIDILGTRASNEQFCEIKKVIDCIQYDSISKIMKIERNNIKKKGLVAVCTAGTSDISIAEEAAQTAEFFGSNILRIYDIGIAGIHRLLSNIDEINKANCIISVAGMEGALAGVIAGLVDKPVIAVPTSIGYGANFGGISALLTMINSCAEGIAVVNIDNGFGAGYIANQINNLVCNNF